MRYLRDMRADMAYFGRSFRRADLTADIAGLDIEGSVPRIERLLGERQSTAGASQGCRSCCCQRP